MLSPAESVAGERVGGPALGEVIRYLDSEVLRVLTAPAEASARVSDVVILDPSDDRCVAEGSIVLGVGLSIRGRDALALLERAGRHAAAVVVRTYEEVDEPLLAAAAAHDVAILAVPTEMPWGQVYSLLRTALVSAGASGEPDAAGVPVGDLFALADAVAAAVGGPVTIEDPQWRVLAFSNLGHEIDEPRRQTILGRRIPDVWAQRLEEAHVTESIKTGRGVVRFDGGDDEERLATRIAAPVRAGGELLGSIWVAEADVALGPEAEETLERAAELAAIHLICHRASEDVKRRARGSYVRELLAGRMPPAALTDSPLRSTGPFTVVAFESLVAADEPVAVRPERILSVICLYFEDFHADAVCAHLEDRFWALVPSAPALRRSVLDVATTIVERVRLSLGIDLVAGVGVSVPDLAGVPRSRQTAQQAVAVIAQGGQGGRVAHIDQVRAHALVLELLEAAEERPHWRAGKVQALLDHDREHATGYAETLCAYLDCWGDVAATARRLGLHPNSLRYRVRRLVELSGLDLDDPDERFVAELQVRLLR